MTASDIRRQTLESSARKPRPANQPGSLRQFGLAAMLAGAFVCLPAQAGGPVSFALDASTPASPGAPVASPSLPSSFTPETVGQAAPRQSARGLFAATLLTIVAQGFGQSISNGFSQGITGRISRWFEGSADPAAAEKVTPVAAEKATPGAAAASAPASSPSGQATAAATTDLHAGFAFEVVLIGTDGKARAVAVDSHEFRTGDRIMVFYRPTMPGRIEVFNINPAGVESRIDAQDSAGGELARLGPFQFVGDKGEESLRIMTTPCQNPKLLEATRAIIKVSHPATQAASGDGVQTLGLPPCAAGESTRARGIRRDIQKVVLEGSVSFALDRVEPAELAAGAVAARSVAIRLLHR